MLAESRALQRKLDDADRDKLLKIDAFKGAMDKFDAAKKLMKITSDAVVKQACVASYSNWKSQVEKKTLTCKFID